jgi:folate-binding protein YgfZ
MENNTESHIKEGNWIHLKNRAVFRLTGPDRVRYLNGQVSNDVSLDLEANAIAACVCSLKGKVEALVWISSDKDSLIIDGEIDQREQLFERLDRYLIADDCELHDITDELTLFHHFNESEPGITSRRSSMNGKDLWLAKSENHPFDETQQLSHESFEFAELLAKIPKAGLEITANEFPAELGLDTWAVNFHKGCYLGQEVISRIESVGRVKRTLLLSSSVDAVDRGKAVTGVIGNSEVQGRATRESLSGKTGEHLTLTLFKTARTEEPIKEPVTIKNHE